MNWKYFFAHEWLESRNVWEDVYLMPEIPNYQGRSLWVTIDALGDPSDPTHGTDRREFVEEALPKLSDAEYCIEGHKMIVRARAFTKEELLDWVRIWLRESGFGVDELIEGTAKEFDGTNEHLGTIDKFVKDYEDSDGS